PDQSDVPVGSLRFVMSVRAIGEGHRSSIGFRTGMVDSCGQVTVDSPPPFATAGTSGSAPLEGATFRSELHRLDSDGENVDYVFDALDERFTAADLAERLNELQANLTTRRGAERTIEFIRGIAERTYGIEFAANAP